MDATEVEAAPAAAAAATTGRGSMVRARAVEERLEGWAAIKAGAERMRVMRESLGHPTALGNLKLKVEVQVSFFCLLVFVLVLALVFLFFTETICVCFSFSFCLLPSLLRFAFCMSIFCFPIILLVLVDLCHVACSFWSLLTTGLLHICSRLGESVRACISKYE